MEFGENCRLSPFDYGLPWTYFKIWISSKVYVLIVVIIIIIIIIIRIVIIITITNTKDCEAGYGSCLFRRSVKDHTNTVIRELGTISM